MKYYKLLLLLVFISSAATAQKKPLDHNVYDEWNTIGGFQITDDGSYTTYYSNVNNGDGVMNITNLKKSTTIQIPRAARSKITKDGKFVCFAIRPEYAKTKEAKDKKLKGDKIPKDSLGIITLASGAIFKVPYLKEFELAKEGSDYLAFQTTPPADTTHKKDKAVKKKVQKGVGEPLMIFDFATSKIDTLNFISDYKFNTKGDKLFFICSPRSDDSTLSKGLYVYNLKSKATSCILSGSSKCDFTLPTLSEDEKAFAFYANTDTTKKFDENVEIYVFKEGYESAKLLVSNKIKGINEGWQISKNRSMSFNNENKRLFFGIGEIQPQKDTTLVESDLAKLDVWSYQDKYIQPLQLLKSAQDLKRSYVCQINVDEPAEFVQLAFPEFPVVRVGNKWSAEWGYAVSSEKYALQSQWDANPKNDLYIVDVKTGKSKLLLDGEYISSVEVSPEGKYLIWYNNVSKHWFIYDSETGLVRNASESIKVPLWNELHDTPEMASAYGNDTWLEKDEAFLIYDRYDIWLIDPKGVKDPYMLTDGLGREKSITFREIDINKLQLPPGTPGIVVDPLKKDATIFFTAFDNITKGYGYYQKDMKAKNPVMKQLIMEPNYSLSYLNKAKDANIITYVKSNFSVSPDMWVTKNMFKTSTKVSDVNPQQKDYLWGTCELVKWTSRTGKDLEGLLYKPENFDPAKKYPMVVYFYERTSQYKNMYRAPALSKSTINVTYFTSNGYLVFMPDVYFEIGHPGRSAMDCIIPGVEQLCKNNWVDRENIGIQGQSWGGYQVAYIVTQTDMFKAAGAGAPVANMTSAYGGLRTGQGVSRQFQYEHTQSRIGKSLWDKGGLELYIENSPLFYADKIKTPLLIMSNDKDEAVPWYQGIELFTAMRRLGKIGWLLQYNNETHNISNDVNAKDYTIRLYQFFDHYLKGQPMPAWMKYGVPATKKGIDWGLELVPDKKSLTNIKTQGKS